MESKAKIFGHAIHPILIVFPLGLLATAVIFDTVYLVTKNPMMAVVSYWMITAGIIGGGLAAIFGWIDWFAIPSQTRAKWVGLVHGLGNMVVIALFTISYFVRRDLPNAPELFAIVFSYVGAGLAVFTGWLGGELVERLGVGVDTGAHLDAPSSLSNRPAHEMATKNVT